MNKKELIELINTLDLPFEEFVVLSSGGLVLRGIMENANDLDLAVTEKGFEILNKKYDLIEKGNNLYQVNDKVECMLVNMKGKKERVGDYFLQEINDYFNYLKTSEREKDKIRIPLVKSYIKNCENHFLYNEYIKLLQKDENGNEVAFDFLKDYLNVPSLIRLKKICYFCGMDYASKNVYSFKEKYSRYEHSISVALITWKFTHDKAQTISALFHDVATPCFAHVIDYMNKDYSNQESTEELTEKIIKEDKELVKLLNRDGIKVEDICDFKKYSVVDNKRPKMCADRFDGLILTGYSWVRMISFEDVKRFVDDLTLYINEYGEEEIGFKTRKIGEKVVEISEKIDIYCHSDEDNYMMELLADITRKTIENKIIDYEDLYYLNEIELFDKIRNSKNKELLELLNKFENIDIDEIPKIILEGVKPRDLNPLVGENERVK